MIVLGKLVVCDELVGYEPVVIHAVDNLLFSWDAKTAILQMYFI